MESTTATFWRTLSFLYGRERGPRIAATIECEMRQFRGFLHALPVARPAAIEARRGVEQYLRKVMARTERVASTTDRDSMVDESSMAMIIQPTDLREAAAVSDVARALDAPEITEYWKSAPYLLNFMRDYALKRLLKDNLDRPAPNLREALARARSSMLDRGRLDTYEPLEPANGRMRGVMDEVFGDGLDQHLWIPPSLPYLWLRPAGSAPDQGIDLLILVDGPGCDRGDHVLRSGTPDGRRSSGPALLRPHTPAAHSVQARSGSACRHACDAPDLSVPDAGAARRSARDLRGSSRDHIG